MPTKDISNKSKRFYSGSIHEIQGGKIKILNRFLGEDEKTVMLEYELIETGQVIINKEVNVSASIYKFSRLRKDSGFGNDDSIEIKLENQEKSTQIITPKDSNENVQKVFSEAMFKLGELAKQHQEDISSRKELFEEFERLINDLNQHLNNFTNQHQHLEFIRMQQETIQRQQTIIETLANKIVGNNIK